MFKLNYISKQSAYDIKDCLFGRAIPSENRVLVLSPNGDEVTSSGIIIPGEVKEGKPRKGVVITSGYIDEYHKSYVPLVDTGMIVTYGLYAGKEVEFNPELFPNEIYEQIKSSKFTILDLNEIIMSEFNH